MQALYEQGQIPTRSTFQIRTQMWGSFGHPLKRPRKAYCKDRHHLIAPQPWVGISAPQPLVAMAVVDVSLEDPNRYGQGIRLWDAPSKVCLEALSASMILNSSRITFAHNTSVWITSPAGIARLRQLYQDDPGRGAVVQVRLLVPEVAFAPSRTLSATDAAVFFPVGSFPLFLCLDYGVLLLLLVGICALGQYSCNTPVSDSHL